MASWVHTSVTRDTPLGARTGDTQGFGIGLRTDAACGPCATAAPATGGYEPSVKLRVQWARDVRKGAVKGGRVTCCMVMQFCPFRVGCSKIPIPVVARYSNESSAGTESFSVEARWVLGQAKGVGGGPHPSQPPIRAPGSAIPFSSI